MLIVCVCVCMCISQATTAYAPVLRQDFEIQHYRNHHIMLDQVDVN